MFWATVEKDFECFKEIGGKSLLKSFLLLIAQKFWRNTVIWSVGVVRSIHHRKQYNISWIYYIGTKVLQKIFIITQRLIELQAFGCLIYHFECLVKVDT